MFRNASAWALTAAVESCIYNGFRRHSLLSLTSGGKKAVSKVLLSGEKEIVSSGNPKPISLKACSYC